jgi:hypothetical protein
LEHDIADNEQRGRSLFENFMQAHAVPRGADAKALSSALVPTPGLLGSSHIAHALRWRMPPNQRQYDDILRCWRAAHRQRTTSGNTTTFYGADGRMVTGNC